jgi:hypothetical protein
VIIKAGLYVSVIMAFLMVMFHGLLGHPVSDLPITYARFPGRHKWDFMTLGLLLS